MKIEITNDDGSVFQIEPRFFGVNEIEFIGNKARIIVFSDDFAAFECAKRMVSNQSTILSSDGKIDQTQVC